MSSQVNQNKNEIKKGERIVDFGYFKEDVSVNIKINKNTVIFGGLDQKPIIEETFKPKLNFSNTTLKLMPDYKDRKQWLFNHPFETFPSDKEEYKRKNNCFIQIRQEITRDQLKKGIYYYLKSFPRSWTGELINVFQSEPEIILEILNELKEEDKIKPR